MKCDDSRTWLMIVLAVTLLGGLPLVLTSALTPDYDMFLGFYEAVRKSVVEYGQFPFWNAWHFGGTPLFANPQLPVFALETPLIVLFGTWNGVRLAMLGYLLFGAMGMWLLLGAWVRTDFIRAWGAVVFALSGGLLLHLAAGHTVMTAVSFLPWLLWLLPRVAKERLAALGFGVAAGMLLNHSLHYVSLSIVVILLGGWAREWIRCGRKREFYWNWALAGCALLAVGGYRLVLTLDLIREFPRAMDMRVSIPFWKYLLALGVPGQTTGAPWPEVLPQYWSWLELGCYVGPTALAGWALSLRRGWRWYHTLFVICSILALDSACRWLPGWWLREIPPFTSYFGITRWRLPAMCFLALGAAAGWDLLWRLRCARRCWIPVLLALSAAGLMTNAWVTWFARDGVTEESVLAAAKESGDPIRTVNRPEYGRYASVCAGLAQLFSYEPLMGYSMQYRNRRLSASHPAYGGEFFSPNQGVTGVEWSPNRLVLHTDRNTAVLVNINPGSYWRDGIGRRIFPGRRSFEVGEHFIVKLPPGQFEIQAVPPLHEMALALTVVAVLATLALYFIPLRRGDGAGCSN